MFQYYNIGLLLTSCVFDTQTIYFLSSEKIKSWTRFVKSPDYYSWRGNSFEIVCLNHIPQIKTVLGISGIESSEYSWKSSKKKGVRFFLFSDGHLMDKGWYSRARKEKITDSYCI